MTTWLITGCSSGLGRAFARAVLGRGHLVLGDHVVLGVGNLAVAQTAKAAPDGYTFAMGGNAALVINPNLMDHLGYDPIKDFAYITQVFIVPNMVVVRPDFPAKDMKELIALKKRSGST